MVASYFIIEDKNTFISYTIVLFFYFIVISPSRISIIPSLTLLHPHPVVRTLHMQCCVGRIVTLCLLLPSCFFNPKKTLIRYFINASDPVLALANPPRFATFILSLSLWREL